MSVVLDFLSRELDSNINNVMDAYKRVPLVRQCVELRAQSLQSVPYTLEDVEDWPLLYPYESLIAHIVRSLDIFGEAYLLKVRNNQGAVITLQPMNASTVRTELAGVDIFGRAVLKHTQYVGNSPVEFAHDDVVYLRYYSPDNDVTSGISPIENALVYAKLLDSIASFSERLFKSGLLGNSLIVVPPSTSESERNRLQAFIKNALSGVRNAFRAIAVSSDIQIKQLMIPLDDVELERLVDYAQRGVLTAFGVPESFITNAANYATATEHKERFWQNILRPLGRYIESELNNQLFSELDAQLVLRFEELDVFQSDENERAQSVLALTQAGAPLAFVLQWLGYDIPDEHLVALESMAFVASSPLTEGELAVDEAARAAQIAALARWEKAAINRLREGKPDKMLEFEHEALSAHIKAITKAGLRRAKTIDEVKQLFKDVRRYANN